jgi:hypothetical protein
LRPPGKSWFRLIRRLSDVRIQTHFPFTTTDRFETGLSADKRVDYDTVRGIYSVITTKKMKVLYEDYS